MQKEASSIHAAFFCLRRVSSTIEKRLNSNGPNPVALGGSPALRGMLYGLGVLWKCLLHRWSSAHTTLACHPLDSREQRGKISRGIAGGGTTEVADSITYSQSLCMSNQKVQLSGGYSLVRPNKTKALKRT